MTKEPNHADEKLETLDTGPEALPWLEELAPRQIVAELDRYVAATTSARRTT
jgi:hypothetical protein